MCNIWHKKDNNSCFGSYLAPMQQNNQCLNVSSKGWQREADCTVANTFYDLIYLIYLVLTADYLKDHYAEQ